MDRSVQTKSTLNKLPIISSGSVIVYVDDELELRPFNDDFAVKFDINFDVPDDHKTSIAVAGDEARAVSIKVRRPFRNGMAFSTGKPLEIAEDDDGKSDFFGSFTFQAFGNSQKYTLIVTYTIVQKSRIDEGS